MFQSSETETAGNIFTFSSLSNESTKTYLLKANSEKNSAKSRY